MTGLKRILGILATVLVLYAALLLSDTNARSVGTHQNLAAQMGFYGIMTLGAGLLIIAGGIDLSIGSVVGLSAVSFALLLEQGYNQFTAAGLVLLGAPV